MTHDDTDGKPDQEEEWTWGEVERLLADLKSDGYDPTLVATVTSAAVPEKKIQINVERTDINRNSAGTNQNSDHDN